MSSDSFLSWYDSDKQVGKPPKGSLALHGAQITPSEREHGFWVLTNSRSLELSAENADTAKTWIEVLQASANQVHREVVCMYGEVVCMYGEVVCMYGGLMSFRPLPTICTQT